MAQDAVEGLEDLLFYKKSVEKSERQILVNTA
jgi:hypothetical protein